MRRRLAALAVVACAVVAVVVVFVAGRGSHSPPRSPAGPAMAEALGYARFDDPAVLAVDTRAPLPLLGLALLAPSLTDDQLSAEDVQRLGGGAAAASLADPTARTATLALVPRDPRGVANVLAGRPRSGTYRGAALYEGGALAVRGRVLLAGATAAAVRRALDVRADPRARLDPATFARRLGALSRPAPARLAFDARALLAARARAATGRSRWLRALRDGAATLTSEGDEVVVRARVASDPVGLTPSDLPFTAGPRPPRARSDQPAVLGVRGLPQLLALLRALDPRRFEELDALDAAIPGIVGVDLGDLIAGLTGDSTVSSPDLRRVVLRAESPDAGAWRTAIDRLDRLTGVLGLVGASDVQIDDEPGPGKRITRDGRLLARVAVVGDAVVATKDPRADLQRAATAPPVRLPAGARGGLVAVVRARLVRRWLAARLRAGAEADAILSRLGDLTGWARAELGGVDAQLRLRVG